MREGVVIRPLASHADYQACVALQYETWGRDFKDAVPASILLVSQKLGGIATGAFDERGELLGFVYGITGVENGVIVHWSDMLAVRPEARNGGVGRRLKEHQRESVARVGARVVYWTYDPLVARNAHLNFNVFGVRVTEYVRDMYGSDTGSDLHRGVGTDRLIVAWPVDDGELAARRQATRAAFDDAAFRQTPVLGDADRPVPQLAIEGMTRARIAVPADLPDLQRTDPAHAAAWRASTRRAFETALAGGFRVAGFYGDPGSARGFYLLERDA
jgi:chorismate synthase